MHLHATHQVRMQLWKVWRLRIWLLKCAGSLTMRSTLHAAIVQSQ